MIYEDSNLQHIPFSERYLTTEEAAEFMNYSINTLNKWRSLGHGPRFLKLGRGVRYKVADLQAFMERHRWAFKPEKLEVVK